VEKNKKQTKEEDGREKLVVFKVLGRGRMGEEGGGTCTCSVLRE
jgi:hypothetical protein